jgi:hypothetical protein
VTTTTELREPPRVSGGTGENAHLDELRTDPVALMARVRAECGDVGELTIGRRDVVLLSGADANEFTSGPSRCSSTREPEPPEELRTTHALSIEED